MRQIQRHLECVVVGEMTGNNRPSYINMIFSAFIYSLIMQRVTGSYQVIHPQIKTEILGSNSTNMHSGLYTSWANHHTQTLLFWPRTTCDSWLKMIFIQYWFTVNLCFWRLHSSRFFTVNVCHKHAFPYSVFMQNPLYSPPTYNVYNIEIVCNVFQYFPSVTLPQPQQPGIPATGHFSRTTSSFCFQPASNPLLKCLNNVSADSDTCYIREISLIFMLSVFFLWSLLSCPVTIL